MRTTFDFAPLWRSTIGFNYVAVLVESALPQPNDEQLPALQLERSSEDHYRISLAAAGFGVNDVTVTAEQNALTVEGKQPEGNEREYRYICRQALPARVQSRRLRSGEAGLLAGRLAGHRLCARGAGVMKPRRIEIAAGTAPSTQIERKKAA